MSISPRSTPRSLRERTALRSGPATSVVIVSTGERADLQRALAVVTHAAAGVETLVVRAKPLPDELRAVIARSGCVLVGAPPGSSVDALRERGMIEASGDVILIREDRDILDAEWLGRARRRVAVGDAEVTVPVVADGTSTARGVGEIGHGPFAASG